MACTCFEESGLRKMTSRRRSGPNGESGWALGAAGTFGIGPKGPLGLPGAAPNPAQQRTCQLSGELER